MALPTLWRRLERAAYEEVRQLLGNRLSERIKLGELREADVRKILIRRLKIDDAKCAAALLKEARTRGNLGFVRAVCRRLEIMDLDGVPTLEAVLQAISVELNRR